MRSSDSGPLVKEKENNIEMDAMEFGSTSNCHVSADTYESFQHGTSQRRNQGYELGGQVFV